MRARGHQSAGGDRLVAHRPPARLRGDPECRPPCGRVSPRRGRGGAGPRHAPARREGCAPPLGRRGAARGGASRRRVGRNRPGAPRPSGGSAHHQAAMGCVLRDRARPAAAAARRSHHRPVRHLHQHRGGEHSARWVRAGLPPGVRGGCHGGAVRGGARAHGDPNLPRLGRVRATREVVLALQGEAG